MKTFIVRTGLFLALASTLLLGGELWVRQVPNDYSYKHRQLLEQRTDTEVLILGSSHSLFGLNPEHFSQRAFNFALTSQSLSYDRYLFERYLPRLPKLKAIVLPIGFFSLGYSLEDGIEAWRKQRYVHYLGYWKELDASEWLELKNYSTLYHNDAGQMFEQTKRYRKRGTSPLTVNTLGWSELFVEQTPAGLDTSGAEAAARHAAVPQRNQPRLDLLAMLETAKKQNIKVLLFIPPAWESYRHAVDKGRMQHTRQFLARLAGQEHVEFIDLFADDRFTEEDFYDGDHLNHKGAQKLSRIISTQIDNKL